MTPKIIVHGGARSSESQEAERRKDVIAACEEGYDVLQKQGAVDAVELAIKRLEASKYINAGVCSYLQLDGRVRMDASIMKDDLSSGAVIGIEDVEHPIAVARKVMEQEGTMREEGRAYIDLLTIGVSRLLIKNGL